MNHASNGLITPERNEMRRAHRVPMPIWVEIEGRTYQTKDWSMTGFGLLGYEGKPQLGSKIQAACVLPMHDAAMRVNTTAFFRGRRGDVSGFEFEELPANKRRIFRHYIEMAIEGRLDQTEDMVSTASLPAIDSPMQQALPLTDASDEQLQREFHWKSAVMLAAGVALLLLVAGIIAYNRVYRLEEVGIISGTIEQVTANADGRLSGVLVNEGAFLDAGTPLFHVEDPELNAQLRVIEAQLKQLAERPQAPEDKAAAVQAGQREPAEGESLVGVLRQSYEEASLELSNARELFEQRIITNKDYSIARNHFLRARTNLLRQMDDESADPPLPVNSQQSQWQRERQWSQQMQVAQLEAQRDALVEKIEMRKVVAPVRGKVFNVAKSPGEYIRSEDVVLLLERDTTPYVLIRVLNEDALKLKPGMPATVHLPGTGQNLQARVSSIGYSAINAEATSTMEASLKETVVRLDFARPETRAPLNSRVRVYVRTL